MNHYSILYFSDVIIPLLHGHILRTKCTWTEDGEKKLTFFLNLEKKNYCNKLITSLEVDGKIIIDKKKSTKNLLPESLLRNTKLF